MSVAMIKGFFAGFIVAQFISAWVSAPVVILAILFYVFGNDAANRGMATILHKLPSFIVTRFVTSDDMPIMENGNHNHNNNNDDNNNIIPGNFMIPVSSPFYV